MAYKVFDKHARDLEGLIAFVLNTNIIWKIFSRFVKNNP